MEDFLSKYGWLIVVAIIIIIAIGLANVSGDTIAKGVNDLLTDFTTAADVSIVKPVPPAVGP